MRLYQGNLTKQNLCILPVDCMRFLMGGPVYLLYIIIMIVIYMKYIFLFKTKHLRLLFCVF